MEDLNGEEETRKLLKYRGDIEDRIKKLEVEIEDLRKAISEIDKIIVKSLIELLLNEIN